VLVASLVVRIAAQLGSRTPQLGLPPIAGTVGTLVARVDRLTS
jgi:hypothetical protein